MNDFEDFCSQNSCSSCKFSHCSSRLDCEKQFYARYNNGGTYEILAKLDEIIHLLKKLQ